MSSSAVIRNHDFRGLLGVTTMYAIEKGIPLVGKKTSLVSSKYPWAIMEIFDSFFVPEGNGKSISVSASQAGKGLGAKFVVRSVDGGIRVWRIS